MMQLLSQLKDTLWTISMSLSLILYNYSASFYYYIKFNKKIITIKTFILDWDVVASNLANSQGVSG